MKKKMPVWVSLLLVCACAVLLLSQVNRLTARRVAAQEAKLEDAARAEALPGAERFEAVALEESRYTLDNLYQGFDAAGDALGYVGQTTVSGYGGPVEVTTGVNPAGEITGVSVGGEGFAETPGLGALTREKAFTAQFAGKTPNVVLNEDGVDTVSGASTTSRAVVSGVNAVTNYVRTYPLGLDEEQTEVYLGATTSATRKGFGGDVTATVGFAEDGTIEYLAVDTPDETDGLGKLASEKAFTSQFIGKTGPFSYGEDGIEAVTGATFTSNAALEAINEIVSGGGAKSAEPVSQTVQGFGGDVTVTVRLNDDNTVAALSIDTPDETDGLGKLASEPAFTDQFIGKTAPFAYGEDGIEAVTGATVTSTAVLGALNELVPAGDKAAIAAAQPQAEQTGTDVGTEQESAPEPEPETEPEPEAEPEAESAVAIGDASRLMRARPAFRAIDQTEVGNAASIDEDGASRLMRRRPAFAAEPAVDDTTVDGAARLMRQRPVFAAEPAADDSVADGAARLMRARPALEAAPAAEADTDADTDGENADASRLMRARPAFNDTKPTEVKTESDAEPVAGDAARLMRQRPSFEAEPVADDTATDDAARLMRARPALDAEEQTEVGTEIALESTTGDASRLMRARPAFEAEPAADDTPAEPAADDTASDDTSRLMRERPNFGAEPVAEADTAADTDSEAVDPSRLMRVRPAFNEAEPTEVETETAPEPAVGDAARLMRARPAF